MYGNIYLQDLVSKLLKVDVRERLTVEKALQHPWVRGVAASGDHMEEAQTNIKLFNARRKMKVRRSDILTLYILDSCN